MNKLAQATLINKKQQKRSSSMSKTKIVKTIVNVEDYQKISAYAKLHGKKIYEIIGEAMKEYIDKYYKPFSIEYPFDLSKIREEAEQKDPPAPTLTLSDRLKHYLDENRIDPLDHTMDTYYKIKQVFSQIDVFMFDKVQHEREIV